MTFLLEVNRQVPACQRVNQVFFAVVFLHFLLNCSKIIYCLQLCILQYHN